LEQIKHCKVFCFSGIGRNDDFQHTVDELGFRVAGFLEFSDHHRYTEQDRTTILRCAEDTGADRLITSEKDYVRIAFKAPLPIGFIVAGVTVSLGADNDRFRAFIHERLKSSAG
jgi:tetraacyldisaccharide-1-P 4'-kinase